MHRLLAAALGFALLASHASTAVPHADASPSRLRIMTFNIRHAEGWDGQIALAKVAEIVMRETPDLVALQEVDEGTERVAGMRQTEELAALTGMHATFGKAMNYQGGEYGVAILSRSPILRVANRALPQADGYEPRTLLSVDVDPFGTGRALVFATTHLDQSPETPNRLAQALQLNAFLAGSDTPTILAGDLNSRPDTDVIQAMHSLWDDMFVEPPPEPGVRPRYRVDYIFARPGKHWRSADARAIETQGVSDHRPIFAVLELTGIS